MNAVYPSRREEAAASLFGDPQNLSVSRQLSAATFRHANPTVRVDELEVPGRSTQHWRRRDGRPVSVGPQEREDATLQLMLNFADQMRARGEVSRDAERHGDRRDGQRDCGGDPPA